MAKKEKKKKFPYKFIRPEELEEMERMTTADLLKLHVKENQNLAASRRQKKENMDLVSLTGQIKKFREENMPKEVKILQDQIKQMKAEVDEEISELIEDKKALTKGFNDTIKAFAERVDVVLKLLAQRNQ